MRYVFAIRQKPEPPFADVRDGAEPQPHDPQALLVQAPAGEADQAFYWATQREGWQFRRVSERQARDWVAAGKPHATYLYKDFRGWVRRPKA